MKTKSAQGLAVTARMAAALIFALSQSNLASAWEYRQKTDRMDGSKTKLATIKSANSASLKWPYSGENRASIMVRHREIDGLRVGFLIQKGQLICGSRESCSVRVRFGDAQPVWFDASRPTDGSSNALFLDSGDEFVALAAGAKRIRIAVTVYENGTQVLEFTTTKPLVWVTPEPMPTPEEIAAKKEAERREQDRLAQEQLERALREAERRESERREAERRESERREAERSETERRALEGQKLPQEYIPQVAKANPQRDVQAQERAALDRTHAEYAYRIQAKIRGNMILPPDIAGNPEGSFDVVQLPTGEIISAEIRKSSGSRAYDDAVLRAILKSSPLPKPDSPDLFQRNLTLKFRPQE